MPKITTQDQARQYAFDKQAELSERDLSYSEIATAQAELERLAEEFNLTEEFKENGII